MTITLMNTHCIVDELSPDDSWRALQATEDAVLVDVRSSPEWSIAGRPDLSGIGRKILFVEWQIWPRKTPNLGFISDLLDDLGDQMPSRLFFLCRAGPRSAAAALEFSRQMQARGQSVHISNIASGFEGEKDENGQTGQH